MDLSTLPWLLTLTVGPILLITAIVWSIRRNKKSEIPEAVTEAGARRLRQAEEERRRAGTDDVER